MHSKKLAAVLFSFIITAVVSAQALRVNNTVPRRDTEGKILDAHDGNLMQFNNTFYLYGTGYGNTDGFGKQNTIECYTSKDLQVWKHETNFLLNPPAGTYYRPKVVYNPNTKKYVLWYNWYPELWDGKYAVATADNPAGPFTVVTSEAVLYNKKTGDFNLMVDDDGTAYISYNTIDGHRIFVEKLNRDYTGSANEVSQQIDNDCEASALFKHGKYYYLLTDRACCFCGEGSGAKVYMSTNPLTGYVYAGNINRYAGSINYAANDGSITGATGVFVNHKLYAQVNLPVSATVQSVKLTVAINRFVSHCIWDAAGKVSSNSNLPGFIISYQSNDGAWLPVKPKTITSNISQLSTQTFTLNLPAIATKKLRITTEDIALGQFLPLNEIQVFSNGKNIAAAANGAIVLEAVTDTVARDDYAAPIIIPAQQTYIAKITTAKGVQYMWMGDLWGSRPDFIKGHDYQYWCPLKFDKDGKILPLEWIDKWTLQ